MTPEWWYTVICDDCDRHAWTCACGDIDVDPSPEDLLTAFIQAYAGEHYVE